LLKKAVLKDNLKGKKKRRLREDLFEKRHWLDVGYGRFVHDPFAILRPPDAGLHDGLLVQLLNLLFTQFHFVSPPKNAFKKRKRFLEPDNLRPFSYPGPYDCYFGGLGIAY
jgi:hypothetical protein